MNTGLESLFEKISNLGWLIDSEKLYPKHGLKSALFSFLILTLKTME